MLKRLENLLKKNKVFYQLIQHKKVYTTFDLHQTTKIPLKEIAKTLLIKADKEFYFVVVAGHRRVDLLRLKRVLNRELKREAQEQDKDFKELREIKLCSERQIKSKITKRLASLISFGSLYKKRTLADKLLLKNKKIVFRAGSFEESIRITTRNFLKIEKPLVGSFSKAL